MSKILCFLGLHRYGMPIMQYLYDEHNISVYRIDRKCKRCGKIHKEVVCFPRV